MWNIILNIYDVCAVTGNKDILYALSPGEIIYRLFCLQQSIGMYMCHMAQCAKHVYSVYIRIEAATRVVY